MAVAKLVCGDCQAVITAGDAYCPSCGAKIERSEPARGVLVCAVCGHRNRPGAEMCASCGARLSPGDTPKPVKSEQRKAQKPVRRGETAPRNYEPWQIISAVAVLALVGYLIVGEITGNQPPRPGTAAGPPANAPFLNSAPPSVVADLGPLEAAVKAQPADAGALLKLANALHDSRMLPRAIDTYKKYLAMRPKDPDARTDLGVCYFQLAQMDSVNATALFRSALAEMEAAFTASPTHQPAAFNMGVVNLHMGDIAESNKWFAKAVELNKNSDLGLRAQNILTQHSFQQ